MKRSTFYVIYLLIFEAVTSFVCCSAVLENRDTTMPERRELSNTCLIDGQEVYLGDSCCEETYYVSQKYSYTCYDNTNNTSNDGSGALIPYVSNCSTTTKDDGLLYVICKYDYLQEDRTCSRNKVQACQAANGRVFLSNLTMECNPKTTDEGETEENATTSSSKGGFIFEIQNHIDCIGRLCSDADRLEYDRVVADVENRRYSMAGCVTTKINGKSLQRLDQEQRVQQALYSLLASALVCGYLYVRCVVCGARCGRRSQRAGTVELRPVRGRHHVIVPTTTTSTGELA